MDSKLVDQSWSVLFALITFKFEHKENQTGRPADLFRRRLLFLHDKEIIGKLQRGKSDEPESSTETCLNRSLTIKLSLRSISFDWPSRPNQSGLPFISPFPNLVRDAHNHFEIKLTNGSSVDIEKKKKKKVCKGVMFDGNAHSKCFSDPRLQPRPSKREIVLCGGAWW